jgi:hypothetical protein
VLSAVVLKQEAFEIWGVHCGEVSVVEFLRFCAFTFPGVHEGQLVVNTVDFTNNLRIWRKEITKGIVEKRF